MTDVDILNSKDCQINWELLESIQSKPLSDTATCFVQCIYAYNNLTAEYAAIKRVLEQSEAMNKSLSEKCDSIESSRKAECERLQKIIDEKEYSVQSLTAILNKIDLSNNTTSSITSQKDLTKTSVHENGKTMQAEGTLENEQDTSCNSQLSIESFNDELMSINDTVNVINGTPPINNTGRFSPIISAGKIKSRLRDNVTKDLVNSNRNQLGRSPLKTKVKKFKQARLSFSDARPSKVIDVTHTESFCGGTRSLLRKEKDDIKNTSNRMAPYDDEVILPSPTSDTTRVQFQAMSNKSSRLMNKPSPLKMKRSVSMIKAEFEPEDIHIDADVTNCIESELNQQTMNSESMATPLIKPNPIKMSSVKKKSPLGLIRNATNVPNTYTQYNTNVSLSVLDGPQEYRSKENVDFLTVKQEDTKSSMVKQDGTDTCIKREGAESPQFIYKEDPVRKKAEKRKMLGWSCNNCKEYYEEAYKGDAERLEKAKQECSKHRGRFNPEKCATPPGFWDIRFSPPEDTEAFNRQNHV